ncbi:MAG TPA: hypothetical protein VM051_00675 [Usitatibacter sp.]|nr:hypothetical protein [Usitatibacter sp.]
MLSRFFAILIAALAIPAFATPQPINATDLWINPDESGWGISVFHQGDTLFASLFVYGPDGQPKWYTASALTPGPFTFSGALTEATGPFFGGAFNPNAVTRRTVGNMTFTLRETDALVSYSVDGTQVSKRVVRFSMRPIEISLVYYGVVLQPAGPASEVSWPDLHILLSEDGSMDTASNTTSTCYFPASSRSQNGEFVSAAGTTSCPSGVRGPWRMTIDPTATGFIGNFAGRNISDGRIAASRRGPPVLVSNGWVNDLWFPSNEGGWGLNLIEQGDTMFATLFVYDQQGRARWYSASELRRGSSSMPGWTGDLYESTGPYFGTSFNPAAVTRRRVGTMSFFVDESGQGQLSYSVDGTRVNTKSVQRFAFRKNDLSGSYKGMLIMRSDDPRGASYDDAEFTIDDRGDQVVMDMKVFTGLRCTYTGQSLQIGSLRSIAGTHSCGGTFRMDNIQVSANGLTSTFQGPAGHISGLITNGHLSGARR